MIRCLTLLLLAPLLGGCLQTAGVGSVSGGECRIFERPPYVVLGRAAYDQDWIDSQVEGGVGGCHWARPASRPASLDASPKKAAAPVKKKRGMARRIRDRVGAEVTAVRKAAWPAAPTEPIQPSPEPPPMIAPEPPPAPPPRPRSALEELLQPSDGIRKVGP